MRRQRLRTHSLSANRIDSIDMCRTYEHPDGMSKVTIQIRNVPDSLHKRLKARAAMEGNSLSGYLLKGLEQVADRPTPQELAKRLAARTPVEWNTECLPPRSCVRSETADDRGG